MISDRKSMAPHLKCPPWTPGAGPGRDQVTYTAWVSQVASVVARVAVRGD